MAVGSRQNTTLRSSCPPPVVVRGEEIVLAVAIIDIVLIICAESFGCSIASSSPLIVVVGFTYTATGWYERCCC